MHPLAISVICMIIPLILANNQMQQGRRVHRLQKEITRAVEMDFHNYKLYPFAIAKSQQFCLHFQQQQQVKAQIMINWIDGKTNQLIYPVYEQSEYIKLNIMDKNTSKIVQSRKFYYQTGIHFQAHPHHQYSMVFENVGAKNKMIQLAISKIQPYKLSELVRYNSTSTTTKIIEMGRQIEEELVYLTRKSQSPVVGIYSYLHDNLSNLLIFTFWEVCLLAIMVIAQVILFKNIIRSHWSFI